MVCFLSLKQREARRREGAGRGERGREAKGGVGVSEIVLWWRCFLLCARASLCGAVVHRLVGGESFLSR